MTFRPGVIHRWRATGRALEFFYVTELFSYVTGGRIGFFGESMGRNVGLTHSIAHY